MKSNKMNGLFFVHLHLYLSEQLLQKNQNRIHGRNFVNKVKYQKFVNCAFIRLLQEYLDKNTDIYDDRKNQE